jgi:hypothetical protein
MNGTSEDVLGAVKTRLNQRGYQRGVHRGERIDPSDYYLPNGMTADRGIARQMQAARKGVPVPRYTPAFAYAPAPHLPNDGKANLKSNEPYELNRHRITQLNKLTPGWK